MAIDVPPLRIAALFVVDGVAIAVAVAAIVIAIYGSAQLSLQRL